MPKQALTLFEVAAMALLLMAAGCHKVDPSAGDPADANLAPTSGTLNDSLAGAGSAQLPSTSPAGTAPYATAPGQLASPGSYAGAVPGSASSAMPPPPPEDTPYASQTQGNPGSAGYADEYAAGPTEANEGGDYSGEGYEQAAYADTPPPPLPEYDQPPCPGDNYLWTPGYWNYAQSSYFWVPGVWVVAPFVGALWTPGYWNFGGGRYGFHHGYWGPHIGFYGGIDYGHGFFGHGYEGGYWNHDRFEYNRAVTQVNTTYVHNTYVRNVTIVNNNRTAYDGGRGGLDARPAPYEQAAAREQHFGALPVQQQHVEQARTNRAQFSGAGGGRPQLLADARPLGGRTAATPQAARLAPLAGRAGFAQTGGAGSLAQEQSRSSVPLNQQPAGRTQQEARQAQAVRGEGNRPPVIINGNEAGAGQERAQGARSGLEQQQQREQQQREQQQREQQQREQQQRPQQQAQQPRPQYTQQPRIVEDQGGSQGRSAAQPRQPYQPQQRAQPQFNQPRPAPAPEAQPRPEQSRPEQPRPEQSRPEQSRPQPQINQPRSAPAPEAPHTEPARPAGGTAGGGGGHGPR